MGFSDEFEKFAKENGVKTVSKQEVDAKSLRSSFDRKSSPPPKASMDDLRLRVQANRNRFLGSKPSQ